jgi:hypothetical protein
MSDKSTADVAGDLKCSKVMVHKLARSLGVGYDFGGSVGFRFTDADVQKMRDSLRIQAPVAARRRRRAS